MGGLFQTVRMQIFRKQNRPVARPIQRRNPLPESKKSIPDVEKREIVITPQVQDCNENIGIGKDIKNVEDRVFAENREFTMESGLVGEKIPEDIWATALEATMGDRVSKGISGGPVENTAEEELAQGGLSEEKNAENPIAEDFSEKKTDDDFLLAQIDEFRVKAQHLQQLLLNKEAKAQELQQLVDEREGKAEELQQILDERQERADGFTIAVEKKIDSLMEDVNVKLEEVGTSIGNRLTESQQADREQVVRLQESLEEVSRKVDSVNRISERVESLREISQKVDALSEISEKVDTLSEISEKVDGISRISEKIDGLSQVPEQLNTVKTDLSDKIHTESVQSYRNLSEILKNVDERLNKVSEMEKQVKKLKGLTGAVIAFTLINLAGAIVAILVSIGIF